RVREPQRSVRQRPGQVLEDAARHPVQGPDGLLMRSPAMNTTKPAAALVLLLLAAIGLLLSACIQPHATYEPFSVITVNWATPPNLTRAGIRVAISGTGLTAGDNDSAFTDSSGFASIRTQAIGRHFVVARHQAYDITFGGSAGALAIGGPTQVFERGRLFIP